MNNIEDRNLRKKRYDEFCQKVYVPIFSKPWWMDAVCGEDNWDVWLYESGGNVLAAMPYYLTVRNSYYMITKPLLTQNNGIIFQRDPNAKRVSEAELQEKVIDAACAFIASLGLDLYEQQFHHSFQNWSPFFWNGYTCITRYTYVIENTSSIEAIIDNFSANYRKNIRKGKRMTSVSENLTEDRFWEEHQKIFLKQNLPVPFQRELWKRLYATCATHQKGKIICSMDEMENIHSVMFVVWDEKSVYPLLGGYIPEFASSQSYPALTLHSIEMAHKMGKSYDFEGSMIKRIAHSFRQYGGVPKPYYRIRKIFNPAIIRQEAEEQADKML